MSQPKSATRDPLLPDWPCEIKYKNKVWSSAEHLYQGLKYEGSDNVYMELIRKTSTPRDAAALGKRGRFPQEGWEGLRYRYMWTALFEKFMQHENLRRVLVLRENFEINIPYSRYWTAHDRMAGLLMFLRHELRDVPFKQLSLEGFYEQR